MPIDYKKYPSNWKTEIRPAILQRAQNCCEFCGLQNYAIGYPDENDCWHDGDVIAEEARDMGYKVIKIVLTVAHLDHDVNNNDFSNLKALCQRCHNRYDVSFRKENRKKSFRIKKGILV